MFYVILAVLIVTVFKFGSLWERVEKETKFIMDADFMYKFMLDREVSIKDWEFYDNIILKILNSGNLKWYQHNMLSFIRDRNNEEREKQLKKYNITGVKNGNSTK